MCQEKITTTELSRGLLPWKPNGAWAEIQTDVKDGASSDIHLILGSEKGVKI